METVFSLLMGFAFFYPLLMSYIFMEGAVIYFFRYEYRKPGHRDLPELSSYPFVSVLLPCYNESYNVRETISALTQTLYPNYEIIAINDGSKDNTLDVLMELMGEIDTMRVIDLDQNHGKAAALKAGAVAARGEFLVCIDGDSLLEPTAIHWFMSHFLSSPRVGAVTGNPRVRTRSTLIGKIQVGEFSAIIGLMKRAQRIYGRIFTISGVVCAFRKAAIAEIGFWNSNVQTEDIEISWNLQLSHWDVRYEPRCVCWVLMPETLTGLVRQRYRWAVGGAETIRRYTKKIFRWKSRRMWSVYFEYAVSVLWAYNILFVITVAVIGAIAGEMPFDRGLISSGALILGGTCLLQFFISMRIDSHYDYNLMRIFPAIIWYPLIYWLMNCLLTIVVFMTTIVLQKERSGKWVSPDRGIHTKQAIQSKEKERS